jgi:hypothetical protein
VIATAFLWWPFTLDDAYITWRYALHLAHGLGPVFNPGETVEGTSSPGWMLLLAAAARLGLDISASARVLSALSGLFVTALVFVSARRLGCRSWVAGLACAWLVLLPNWQAYLVSGLETIADTAAVTALAVLPWLTARHPTRVAWVAVAATAVVLLRPTGLFVAGVVGASWWRSSRDPAVRLGLAFAAVAGVASLVTRHATYGAWVPNTYLVKPPPLAHLLESGDFGTFVSAERRALWRNALPEFTELGGIALIGCALLGVTRSERPPVVPALAATGLAGIALVAVLPSDWMLGQRFALPFYPALVLLAALGAERLVFWVPSDARRLAVAASLLALAVGAARSGAVALDWLRGLRSGSAYPPLRAEQQYLDIGRWLADHARPGETVLCYEVGAVGYGSELTVIDHEGLVTPDVARVIHRAGEYGPIRTGRDPEGMREVVECCVRRRPDWFLVRTHIDRTLALGAPPPRGIADEPIQNALLDRLDDEMVLAASFPLAGADGPRSDRYLVLRREPVTPGGTSPR